MYITGLVPFGLGSQELAHTGWDTESSWSRFSPLYIEESLLCHVNEEDLLFAPRKRVEAFWFAEALLFVKALDMKGFWIAGDTAQCGRFNFPET